MKCPFCSHIESKVIDSRPTDEGVSIRRRRECLSCSKRFTTYETIENMPIIIVKKDGSRQVFDREKLLRGLVRACEKRPVVLKDLEVVVDEIEANLQNSLEKEIDSCTLGELVLERLRKVDEVAYIRFASVYRRFDDITSFMNELRDMMADK